MIDDFAIPARTDNLLRSCGNRRLTSWGAAMTSDQISSPTAAGPAPSRFNLKSCLLIGVGCLAILAVGLCLAAALFLPRLRAVYEEVRSGIGLDSLQELGDLSVPGDLIEGVGILPTAAPDLCMEGLCLSYPEGLSLEALVITQPGELDPEFWAVPEHLEIRFVTYPLMDTFHEPHVSLFNIERFRQVNSNVGPMLDELSSLLLSQPATPESIPLIPIFNAAQIILTQVEYLEFDGGTGVRFVTQYGQGIWPINNLDLFYAFIGLSNDGQTLVSAIMPVANQGLPDDPETIVNDDYDAFAEGYAAYIATTEAMLDGAGPGTFSPNLDDLDALMRSIQLFGAP